MSAFNSGSRVGWRDGYLLRFLGGLRSWQLFMVAAALLLIDLAVPDPIPLLDEIVLVVLTYLLSRWKKQAS